MNNQEHFNRYKKKIDNVNKQKRSCRSQCAKRKHRKRGQKQTSKQQQRYKYIYIQTEKLKKENEKVLYLCSESTHG